MHRHLIYIINPISGTRNKEHLPSLIEQKTRESGFPFAIFPSVASGDYSFLHDIIKEQQTTDIIIAGGDGTVSQVVGSLRDLNLAFGIIPCGSGNGLAYSAKIPKQASAALDIVFKGNAPPVDGFYVNNHFSCMLCGLGFDAKVAHDFAQQSKRGLSTYVKQVIKNFFLAKPYSFELQLPGSNFATDAYFISIANSNQFGNNFTIAPKASLSDGLLDIVIAADQNRIALLLQTLKQIGGFNPLQNGKMTMNKKGIIYFQTERLTILNKSQAPLHIDGDPAESPDRLEVEVKKNYFRLLQP